MSDIPKHIQKRAMEIYTSSHCTLKEAFDKAFMEDQMRQEGFPQDIDKLFGGIFGRKK